MKSLGVEIINTIKNENNLFLDTVNLEINQFLDKNKDYLDQLFSELNILFSEETLENIANAYNKAFNKHLNTIIYDLQKNKNLSEEYFDGIVGLLNSNQEVVRLLQNYPVNKAIPSEIKSCENDVEEHCYEYTRFEDTITNKKSAKGYLNKYGYYIDNLDKSKNYINKELYTYLKEEYKKIVTKIKEILLVFKNNKISDKYPNYNSLYFIDNHLKNMENFYIRLKKYISEDIFNNYYIPIIENFKENQTSIINNIKQYINDQCTIINGKEQKNDYINDICTAFKRKRIFTCRNGVLYNKTHSDDVCIVSWGTDNYLNLKNLSLNSDVEFDNIYNNFYSLIENKIISYSNIIDELKTIIPSIEEKILNQNKNNNYLIHI